MTFKVKIKEADITFGPKTEEEINALGAMTVELYAKELIEKGYRKTSNAYCRVARIDREDWVKVLAKERFCSVADFYNVDGSGIGDQHRDYYIRTHSKDELTVHPLILRKIPAFW